jgi:hypothetical protein
MASRYQDIATELWEPNPRTEICLFQHVSMPWRPLPTDDQSGFAYPQDGYFQSTLGSF